MCGASWWCGGDSGEGGMRASSGDAQTLVSCVALVLAHVECGRWGLGGMWSVRESRDSHAARWMVYDSDATWSSAMYSAKLPSGRRSVGDSTYGSWALCGVPTVGPCVLVRDHTHQMGA